MDVLDGASFLLRSHWSQILKIYRRVGLVARDLIRVRGVL